jgi:hypothetical protein
MNPDNKPSSVEITEDSPIWKLAQKIFDKAQVAVSFDDVDVAAALIQKAIDSHTKELRLAICPDGSITDHAELLEFCRDLNHAYNQASGVLEQYDKAARLERELSSLQEALERVRCVIMTEDKAIVDTIWESQFCTLVDYIDCALSAGMPREAVQTYLDGLEKRPTYAELQGEVERLWEALRPFYAFGAVLKTATEENGYDWVSLFTGTVEPVPAEEGEVTYDILEPESCIVDVHAGWAKTPATYCGPILRAKHFFEATAAFMSVERLVEKDKLCQALEKGNK